MSAFNDLRKITSKIIWSKVVDHPDYPGVEEARVWIGVTYWTVDGKSHYLASAPRGQAEHKTLRAAEAWIKDNM